ncbi:hypothetical protein ABEX25_28400, partial [Paenibacillus thiaminolyticus]|uniref:hypothetical protein n=1 Tax=Paenibacillus thiaminolyticus TaxID=49283 RepID=UPI003D2AF0EC
SYNSTNREVFPCKQTFRGKELTMITVKGRTYKRPLVCCGFCGTPVYVLHNKAHPSDLMRESILKSQPIAPQQVPDPLRPPTCATCGKKWLACNFKLEEGDKRGKDTTDHPSRD